MPTILVPFQIKFYEKCRSIWKGSRVRERGLNWQQYIWRYLLYVCCGEKTLLYDNKVPHMIQLIIVRIMNKGSHDYRQGWRLEVMIGEAKNS